MDMIICTVRDAKAEVYMRPFMMQTAGAAIRSFSDEVMRDHAENMMYHHPSDFALYEIGVFDDNKGTMECFDIPKLLIQADQIRSKSSALPKNVQVAR